MEGVPEGQRVRTIYMSPPAESPFKQADAVRLRDDYDRLILVCGHYEGIDERFIEECVDEEISLGDFVLTGGEIPAMAVADAVCRLVPGVLSDPECYENESHWDGLLEFPQYSRPEIWHGRAVPPILLSGHHANVAKWRRKQSIIRTRDRRPDMYAKLDLSSKADQKLLQEIAQEEAEQKKRRSSVSRLSSAAAISNDLCIIVGCDLQLLFAGASLLHNLPIELQLYAAAGTLQRHIPERPLTHMAKGAFIFPGLGGKIPEIVQQRLAAFRTTGQFKIHPLPSPPVLVYGACVYHVFPRNQCSI